MTSPYKRAYKACEGCRRGKAKCIVGEDSNSCQKCIREQKDCVFPAQRTAKRAKVAVDASAGVTADTGTGGRNGRTSFSHSDRSARVATVDSSPSSRRKFRAGFGTPGLTARSSTHQQRSRNEGSSSGTPTANSQHQDVTYPAGQQTRDQPNEQQYDGYQPNQITANLRNNVVQTLVTNSSDTIGLLFQAAEHNDSDSSDEHAMLDPPRQSDVQSDVYSMPSPAVASNETLAVWERHRFVRQGWFTPREAVSFIEFFFQFLSPLSPVADSFYADHKSHKTLILEEPLLCCTLIMIASRYHVPTRGTGGRARVDFVHNRVWRHIEHLISRITFGSEKYSVAKTRTLGSIQALLLIIEWHPRALHFPPENDGWDASLAASTNDDFHKHVSSNSDASKRWREDVFEPAKRSDRMSWMLVGLAITLAHELGVFDPEDEDSNVNDAEAINKRQSKLRTRRLLFIYASQLSMRLGCSNVFPHGAHQNITFMPSTQPAPAEQASQDREKLITKWIEVTKLMMTANEMLYASKTATRQVMKGSRYIAFLEHFQPLLDRCYDEFQQMSCITVSESARKILLVEFYFVRMYINSIALQALVERASSQSTANIWLEQDLLRPENSQDFRFVEEVRDSSVEILRIATELSEHAMLQYCPVRFFLRVVAASIYLLKVISIGSREADVTRSLEQLERCIQALETDQADDIHLASRYANLIARHVRRFKRNFRVQKAATNSAVGSRGVHRGPAMSATAGQVDSPHFHTRSGQYSQGKEVDTSGQANSSVYGDRLGIQDDQVAFDFTDSSITQDWLAQPFNSHFAPFGVDGLQPNSGLAVDSLDFLWNMAT